MNIVYTYYESSLSGGCSGFSSTKEMAASIMLSMQFARKNIDSPRFILVCNQNALSVIEHYGLRFDFVDCCLDEYKEECDLCWSFAKLVAYSRQSEKFIHIDNDVYIIEKLDSNLFNSKFFFQNEESLSTHLSYSQKLSEIKSFGISLPSIFLREKITSAVNCGIVYGNDQGTFIQVLKIAREFLSDAKVKEYIKLKDWYINHVIEQYLISCVLSAKKIPYRVVIDNFSYENAENEKRIVHLWGDAKANNDYVEKIFYLLEDKSILEKETSEKSINHLKVISATNSDSPCKDAVVISLQRNWGGRLKIFKSRFNFNINLSVIEGVDGLAIKKPKYTKLQSGTYGCLLSHINAIKFAKSNNLDCILILEDDVRFVMNFEAHLKKAFSELPENWDMLWLGGADSIPPSKYSDSLNILNGSWGGYAYILRSTVYDFFIDCLSQGTRPCDDYYQSYQRYFNSFRTKRPLVLHNHSASVRQSADKGIEI